jgi:hypothetical protein
MREEKSQFVYRILPIDPDFPTNPRRPSPEIQQEALTDVLCQLVTYLAAAAKASRSDPFKAIRVLANCERILDSYASANFDLIGEYQRLLKTNLRAALRQARRTFFREAFLSRSMEEFSTYRQTMVDAGWRMSHPEAFEDYNTVVEEMFEGDRLRASALQERKRRSNMA